MFSSLRFLDILLEIWTWATGELADGLSLSVVTQVQLFAIPLISSHPGSYLLFFDPVGFETRRRRKFDIATDRYEHLSFFFEDLVVSFLFFLSFFHSLSDLLAGTAFKLTRLFERDHLDPLGLTWR